MRLALCGLSAVLLSGCSWLNSGSMGPSHGQYKAPGAYHHAQYGAKSAHNPCVIYSPVQPVPMGCDPASVTLATGAPTYGGGQYGSSYATGGYGSHAGQAGVHQSHYGKTKGLKKPRLRGSLSLGIERSYGGDLLDYAKAGDLIPDVTYDPLAYAENFTTGSVASGNITDTLYYGDINRVVAPNVSFDDVYTTPASLKAGVEYIVSPKFTVFANGGYAQSEGVNGTSVTFEGDLAQSIISQDYDTDTGAPIGPAITNTTVRPNTDIAYLSYDFSDMKRVDLEVGARKYFDPVSRTNGYQTLTPFVGVAAGASHYNAVDLRVSTDHLFLREAWQAGDPNAYQYYRAEHQGDSYRLYDSEWIPHGQLTAGMEWQVTPKTALALETGVKYEGKRELVNGESGDNNISVPVTLRGSFNF